MPTGPCNSSTIPLSRLPAGAEARVLRLEGDGVVCQRLRELGFCESAIVSRVSGRHSMVCQVCGSRVALHRMLAEKIHVEPLLAVGF
jgi:ferrous iron transport protein A